MRRTIGFFVTAGFQLLDLAGPLCAFQEARLPSGKPAYRTRVLSRDGRATSSESGPAVSTERLSVAKSLDTLIVVGGRGPREASDDATTIAAVESLASISRRVASVCTGAALLAATGRLDGRRATTHWRHSAALQRRHPDIRVQADCIYVQDGVWTSAGITAGIDLALAMIEADLGEVCARNVSRDLVVQGRRTGGQAQFSSSLSLEPVSARLRRAWTFAQGHLRERLSVERLAASAAMSARHFAREFRAETGHTPARAVELLRVEAARARMARREERLERIAAAVGFGSAEQMRRAFLRTLGQTPQAVKRAAR